MLRVKSCKTNQSQGNKQFERCEYKIACRPSTQLFKSCHDDKIKKNEENPALPQKKLMKTNKITNKIFQHNPTDSESLKVYRDLYIYKSLGSVARKNLERAVAIYNANKDEIELSRRFTTKKNYNANKREQPNHKKFMKTEPFLRTMKPKNDLKEKLTKDLKQSLQGLLANNKKFSQLTDYGKNSIKTTNRTNKVELCDTKKDKNQSLKEIEIATKGQDKCIKKLVVKNDVKRILPKLPIRPIERKIKEKKQLTLAVLNISLPSLKKIKGETSNNSNIHNYKNTTKYNEHTNYSSKKHTYFGLEEQDEIYCTISNRKRIVDDIRRQLHSPNKIKASKKRSCLLKLPITTASRKGSNTPSSFENINLLTIQDPDRTFTLPLPINNSLSMLSQDIIKEESFYDMAAHSPFLPDHFKNMDNERRKKYPTLHSSVLKNPLQRHKTVATSKCGKFVNINEEQKSRTLKNDLRKMSLNSQENFYNFKRNELNVF
ncbi:uncharacterized protein [Halyomorpha halys]|nr:uncharacterized protein LOC106692636 isoform X2 [Halyomorpha halys]